MRRSRALLAVLVFVLVVLISSAALAADRTVQTPTLNLTMQTATDDYKVILTVDPFDNLRSKKGVETYWTTVVDNGKAHVMIDPIFVVGN
jgi:hypothetical protein